MKIISTALSIAAFAALSMGQNSAASTASLDQRINAATADFDGKVWIQAKNIDTGAEYSLRGDERVRTASTIKVPIMAEVYRQVAEGKINWTDELTIGRKQGGSGVLKEFTDGSKVDLKTAMHLMIVVSDNTATNLVLDHITSTAVNVYMKKLGLNDTLSLRRIGGGGDAAEWDEPGVNKLFGIGRSSPRDMVRLLEMMEKGELVSKEASAEMIDVLKRQQYKDGLGRGLSDTMQSASKSGALDRFRADVGIVYTRKGRVAMAIYIDDMRVTGYHQENPGLHMIWKLSQILQEELTK